MVEIYTELKRKKIAVLMATFNGGRYIEEQLNSILRHDDDVFVDLFIRDDGSSDETIDIIQRFIADNNNFFLVKSDRRLGAAGSFLELMNAVPSHYDYYAFSDQDDVWLPNKLSRCCDALSFLDADEIAIAYCDYRYINENGEAVFNAKPILGSKINHKTALIENPAPGFAILLNRACLMAARIPASMYGNVRMHDFWVHQVAFFLGHSVRVAECLVDYRIHNANTVGVRKSYSKISTYRRILRNYTMLKRQLKLLRKNFSGHLPKDIENSIDILFEAQRRNFLFRILFIIRNKFYFGSGISGNIRKLIFITGK